MKDTIPVTGTTAESGAAGGRRRVPLPGGGEMEIRPMSAGDVDGLATLYEGLSGEDRYRRFFSCFDPDRAFFEQAVAVASRGGYGLVAVEIAGAPDGSAPGDGRSGDPPRGGVGPGASGDGRIVGDASYELLPNGDGELAMAVAGDRRGWLGPFLLDALIEVAAARGVPNLEADVLVTNRRMLTLLRSRGYATLPSDDWVTVRLIVGTAGRTPVWPEGEDAPVHHKGPRVLVESPGGRWHAAHEAADAGLQVVTCSGPRGPRSHCPALAGRPCPLAAEADAVVVSHPLDDERWGALVDAHGEMHPGVPVCVEPRPTHTPAKGEARPPVSTGDAVVIDVDDPRLVVSIVDRHAAAHQRHWKRGSGPSALEATDLRDDAGT